MGLIILLALGFLLLFAGIVAHTAWLLTHPPRRTYASALARGTPGDPSELAEPRTFETWTFRSRGLDLPVWDLRGNLAAGPVIILIHGWGDSRLGGLARIPHLAPLASRIIAWDLPGHGEAPSTSHLGIAEVDDLLALIEHLGLEVSPVLFGWSLGAGVAIAAAARTDIIAAVIAECPYRYPDTPARNVLRARGLPSSITLPLALGLLHLLQRQGRGLSRPRFDRASHAARASCPILVLHGDCDEVCPIDDGRAIAAAPGARLAIIPAGRHNNLWTTPELAVTCSSHIQSFLGEALARPQARR